jgi:hypothetical protein
MAWLKKKSDPISDRARALNAEIAALEDQIRRLDAHANRPTAHPRLRSTAVPHGGTITHTAQAAAPVLPVEPAPAPREPIFEEVNQERLTSRIEPATTPAHFNELGVRKFDLPALMRRIGGFFHGPTTTNPRLVSYLAAGGVQGLRPLRKEKRVARNRFIFFAIFLFLMLWGIFYMVTRR